MKNYLIKLLIVLFSATFGLILFEFGLRYSGLIKNEISNNNFYEFKCDKGGWIIPYKNIGNVLKPGTASCITSNAINWKFTHLDNFSRATSSFTDSLNYNSDKNEIHFYGCSFLWGQSLNDNETMAWLIQNKYPEIRIVNYGVGGYSNVQSLYLLKDNLIRNESKPKSVCLFYASFHDDRNVLSSSWMNFWNDVLSEYISNNPYNKQSFADFYFPYARIDGNKLVYKQKHINEILHKNNFLTKLTTIQKLNTVYQNYSDNKIRKEEVTFEVIHDFKKFCDSLKIEFNLIGILDDPRTKSMIKRCSKKWNNNVYDISFELRHNTEK